MLSKFSPQLRKALLTARHGESVRGLAEISPLADRAVLARKLEACGADVESWSEQGRMVGISIPVDRASELDAIDDVIYVEAAGRYTY